jgi:hypothetical protein
MEEALLGQPTVSFLMPPPTMKLNNSTKKTA